MSSEDLHTEVLSLGFRAFPHQTVEWVEEIIHIYGLRLAGMIFAGELGLFLKPAEWKSFTQFTYELYRISQRWEDLRRAALGRADHRCQLCNEDEEILDVHHRTYDSIGTDNEANDLVVLCRTCHSNFHREKQSKQKQPVWSVIRDVLRRGDKNLQAIVSETDFSMRTIRYSLQRMKANGQVIRNGEDWHLLQTGEQLI